MNFLQIALIIVAFLFFLVGIRIVRPTERALIERLGKYKKFAESGFHWIIPVIDKLYKVNITEQMVDAQKQEIITDDNLNAKVDAQVYFRVKPSEVDVKASQYNVNDVQYQIVNLARTTLRNIIGTMKLKAANSERDTINKELMKTLTEETKSWGIDVVRTELKEIDPPSDVQETMNKIVKAANEKVSAIDYATAAETKADGQRRASIKEAEGQRQASILQAEGQKQASILKAEGESKAFDMINKAFVGNAQILKKYEVTQASLQNNAKIVLTEKGITPNIIMDAIPIKQ